MQNNKLWIKAALKYITIIINNYVYKNEKLMSQTND